MLIRNWSKVAFALTWQLWDCGHAFLSLHTYRTLDKYQFLVSWCWVLLEKWYKQETIIMACTYIRSRVVLASRVNSLYFSCFVRLSEHHVRYLHLIYPMQFTKTAFYHLSIPIRHFYGKTIPFPIGNKSYIYISRFRLPVSTQKRQSRWRPRLIPLTTSCRPDQDAVRSFGCLKQ